MKAVKKERESNFELLRIMVMFFIVVYHIYCHAVAPQLSVGNAIFNSPIIYKKLFILSIFSPLGKIGDEVFILITGYFMLNKNKTIDLGKIGRKLIIQLLFASVLLVIISIAVLNIANLKVLTISLFDNVNSVSWFIGYYFVIMIIAKLFLNKYLMSIPRKKYNEFLVTLFCISQFGFLRELLGGLSYGLITFSTGVLLYSLGGYINKYKPFDNIKSIIPLIVIIVCFAFVILSTYGVNYNNILMYYKNGSVGEFHQSIQFYEDSSFIPIVIGVSLFELFRRIKVKNNKVINFISSGTFMIYLLHDNPFVYSLWNNIDWIRILSTNPLQFVGIHIGMALLTFIVAFIGYLLYLLVEKIIIKYKHLAMKKA